MANKIYMEFNAKRTAEIVFLSLIRHSDGGGSSKPQTSTNGFGCLFTQNRGRSGGNHCGIHPIFYSMGFRYWRGRRCTGIMGYLLHRRSVWAWGSNADSASGRESLVLQRHMLWPGTLSIRKQPTQMSQKQCNYDCQFICVLTPRCLIDNTRVYVRKGVMRQWNRNDLD